MLYPLLSIKSRGERWAYIELVKNPSVRVLTLRLEIPAHISITGENNKIRHMVLTFKELDMGASDYESKFHHRGAGVMEDFLDLTQKRTFYRSEGSDWRLVKLLNSDDPHNVFVMDISKL
jgi:hypothetical protein